MKRILFFHLFLCLGAILCAGEKLPPLPSGTAPFAVSSSRRIRNTVFIPGKGANFIKGKEALAVVYDAGTPQFQFSDTKQRFGGLAVEVNGANARGTRRKDLPPGQKKIMLDFPDDGIMELSLQDDGRILFSTVMPKAQQLRFIIPFEGVFFSGTKILVNDRSLAIPFADPEDKNGSRILWQGKLSRLMTTGKAFGFTFPVPVDTSIRYYPENGSFALFFTPADPGKKFTFLMDPGSEAAVASPAPANRLTKAAGCDLWELDRYALPQMQGKNYLQNSSFEQGFRYLIFRLRGATNFDIYDKRPVTISDKEALYGKKSLSIFSTADGLWRQPVSMQTVLLPPGKYVVSCYAKTDHPQGQKLLLQASAPGKERPQWPGRWTFLSDQWSRCILPFEISDNAAVTISLEASSTVDATCFIDGIQLEKGSEPTEYQPPLIEGPLVTDFAGNFAEYGKPLNARLEIVTAPETQGSVSVKVRDFFDEVKFQKTFDFTADADGHARIDLPLDDLPRGVFIVETDYEIAGQKRYEIQRFSIMNDLSNTHKHKNLCADTYVDPHFPMQIYRDVLERYRATGYGARSGFANEDDRLAALANGFGISNLLTRMSHAGSIDGKKTLHIWKNIEWYVIPGMSRNSSLLVESVEKLPLTAENLQKVEEAAALRAAASPHIEGWYFVCEPEGVFPDWANPAYAKTDRFEHFTAFEAAVVRGIRRGNPNAKACLSTSSTLGTPDRTLYFEKMLDAAQKNGIHYDWIGVHCYCFRPEYPVSLETNLQTLFAIMDKRGHKEAKICAGEGLHWLPVRSRKVSFVSDYPVKGGLYPYTYDMSYAEKIGAAMRVRCWLIGLKHADRVLSMNAGNYGCFEMDAMLTPYAHQKAANTLGRLLGDADFVRELALFPDTRCYLFEDAAKRPVAVLWACSELLDDGEAPGPAFTFRPQGEWELFDLMEAEHSLPLDAEGRTTISITPFPVFLRGKAGSMDELAAMLTAGSWKSNIPLIPPLNIALNPDGTVTAALTNNTAAPLSAELSCAYGVQEITKLPPGKEKKMTFRLPLAPVMDNMNRYKLDFMLKIRGKEAREIPYERSFDAMLVRKALSPLPPDGDETKWNAYPEIPMKKHYRGPEMVRNGQFVTPADHTATYRMAWADDGLHIAIRVRDDKTVMVKRFHPSEGWKNDSVQIFFDAFADGGNSAKPAMGKDDWNYGIYGEEGKFFVFRHDVPDVQLTKGVAGAAANTVADDVVVTCKELPDGRFYEIHFTPDSLLPGKLAPGEIFGVGIMVNDCDDPGERMPRSRSANLWENTPSEPNNHPGNWPRIILLP